MTVLTVSEVDIDIAALFNSQQVVLHRKTGDKVHRQKESLNWMWQRAFRLPEVEAGFKVREEVPHAPQRPKNPRKNSKD